MVNYKMSFAGIKNFTQLKKKCWVNRYHRNSLGKKTEQEVTKNFMSEGSSEEWKTLVSQETGQHDTKNQRQILVSGEIQSSIL